MNVLLISILISILIPVFSHAAAPDDEEDVFAKSGLEEGGEEEGRDANLEYILRKPIVPSGPDVQILTLDDCIRIALENNGKLKATRHDIEAARASKKETSAIGWPILEYEYRTAPVPKDASAAMTSFFSGDITWWNKLKLALGVPLTSFGKISAAKELAEGGIASAELKGEQERNSVVSKVRQLYHGVLFADEMDRLLRTAHEHLNKEINKHEGEEGEEKDDYSPTDNLRMKVVLYEFERRLADTKEKRELAMEGLRIQMGLKQDAQFALASDKLRPAKTTLDSFEAYYEKALEKRPDLKLLDVGINAKNTQLKLERRKLLPDLGVGAFFEMGDTVTPVRGITATGDFNDPFNFTRAGFGLQLSGKLDLHGGLARIEKIESEYFKSNLEGMMAREGIRLDVQKAYLNAKTSNINLERAERAQRAARQLLFLTEANYEIGVGEQKDYVDALQLVLMTRGRYLEAVFGYNISLAELEEKVGGL